MRLSTPLLPGRKTGPKDGLNGMPLDQIAEICTHISETEANAAAAERRTIDRFAAALFETQLGAVVDGIIASPLPVLGLLSGLKMAPLMD